MIYQERANILKKRRGDSPLLIGDAAASSTTIINQTTSLWGTIAADAIKIILGAALCVTVTLLAGYGHHLSPAESRVIDQSRQHGIDFDSMSNSEIVDRLTLPPDAVASTIRVLQLPEMPSPDMRWVGNVEGRVDGPSLPSRVEALRAVTAYIGSAPSADQSRILDGLRIDAALTERARSIVEALRSARPSDDAAVVHLVPKLLGLPPDQLRTLEQAGFPAIPHDADRQAIYRQLPSLGSRAAAFLWGFVSRPAGYQQAVMGISDALQWRAVDRALGALRDGDPATVTAINGLPSNCTASILSSCIKPSP